ncbi:MAG: hypothetical protein IJU19_09040, partial [Bacteroidales bacterium]|nr:hypothetical protein [Bacteroidales bacterium]
MQAFTPPPTILSEASHALCLSSPSPRRGGLSAASKTAQRADRWHAAVIQCIIFIAAVCGLTNAAQAQGLSGYTYSTGTTSLTQTVSTAILTGANKDDNLNYDFDDKTTMLYDIGFSFPFGGQEYTKFSVNTNGILRLGDDVSTGYGDFGSNDGAPRISGFLCDGYAKANAYVKTGLFGDTLRVVEIYLSTYKNWYENSQNYLWKHQIHLYRSGRVRIIQQSSSNYVPRPDWQVGMSIDNYDGWVVKPDYTAVHFDNPGDAGEYFIGLENSGTVKFVANRWFLFTPPSATLYAVRPPSGVKAASFSSTGFTLSWVGQATATKYIVRYGATEVSTTSTSYAITGLTPQQPLTVQVATVVGTDTSSFTPLFVQMPYSLPYVQNFDSYTGDLFGVKPAGWWDSYDYYGNYTNGLISGQEPYVWLEHDINGGQVCWSCDVTPTTQPGSVTQLSMSNYYNSSDNFLHARTLAALPPFDVNASNLKITFDYAVWALNKDGTESNTNIKLYVGLIKDLSSEEAMCGTANWTALTTITPTLKKWNTVTYTYSTAAAPGTYRLAFYYANLNNGEDLAVYIDNIKVENKSCSTPTTQPTDLYATNLTSSGFRLNWSSTADASVPYTVFLDDQVAGTTANGVKYFDITGLEPLSFHRLQVRAASSCPSLPSDVMFIRTACDGDIDAPYSEDFDDYSGAGVAGGTIAPNAPPIRPGCWTFNGLGTWSTSSYKFTTGIDASKWIATTSNKSLTRTNDNNGDCVVSGLKTMTFSFPFGGSTYTQFSFNEDGQIRLGSDEVVGNTCINEPLSGSGANSNNPKVVGCGMDGQMKDNGSNTYGAWANYSDTVTVVQYRMCPIYYIASDPGVVYLPYQVQLYKSGRILIAYQTMSGTAWSPSYQVGFATDASNVWSVSSDGLSTSFHGNGSSDKLDAWPANGRYFEWKPTTANYPQAFLTSGISQSENALLLVNGRAEDVQHIALPLIESGDLNHLAVSFAYRQSTTATSVGELALGTMADPDDPSTFVLIRTLPRTTSWTTVRDTLGIHDLAVSQQYIALRYTGGTTVGENTAIDNVSVTKIKCLPPTGLTASNITTTSMRLSWTDHNGGESDYVIDLNGTEYVVAAGTNYRDFTGLSHGQPCRFIVKADCDEDGYSATRTLYAATLCDDGVDLPYTENFDYYGSVITTNTSAPTGYPATHTLPNCWTFTGLSASTSTYPQAFLTSSSSWRVTGNGLLFNSNTTAPLLAALPLPSGSIPTSQLRLHFQYKQSDTTNYTGRLVYGLMSDPDDAATFVPLDTLKRIALWTTVDCDIAAHPRSQAAFTASSRVHVAFKYIGGTGNNSKYTAIDDVRLTRVCVADLATSTTATSCRLSWTDVSGGTYGFEVYEGETRLGVVAAGTTYFDITSLTPGSTHTYRVTATCGGCECDPASVTVTLPCNGSLPYAEYFDTYGSSGTSIRTGSSTDPPSLYPNHTMPTCWQFPTMSASSSTFPQVFLHAYSNHWVSSPCGLFMRTNEYNKPVVAIVAQDFGYPLHRFRLQFRGRVYNNTLGSTTEARIEWGVVTDLADPTSFVALGSLKSTSFVAIDDTLGNHSLPSGNLYVAFRFVHVSPTSSSTTYGGIDNVDITLLPDCNVYGLTVSSITNSTATLRWENPTATSWTYTVKNGDDVLASGITDTFCNASSLSASTTYTLTIVPSCGGSGRSISFTTDCDATNYCDNFENYTAQTSNTTASSSNFPGQRPACWAFPGHSGVSGDYPYAVVSSNSSCRNAGSKGMVLQSVGSAAPAVAVLPAVYSTPIAYMRLSLSYKYANASYGELSYGVMSNTYDTNTFIKIGIFPRVNTAWHTDTVYIGHHNATFSSAYKHIVLRYASTGTSYYAAIDDLCLEAQDCPPVGGLTVSNITGTTADLAWTDHSGGTATYHIVVNDVEAYTTAAGATSHTLTGLLRGSVNTIGVYADCGGEHTGKVSIVRVITPCASGVDIPYSENFNRYNENVYNNSDVISVSMSTTYTTPSTYPLSHTRPSCWTFTNLSASTSSYPQIFIAKNPNYNRDGDSIKHRGLMFKNYSTVANGAIACLPLANSGNLNRVKVSFDYKQSHTDVGEGVLSLGVMTDPDDPATFTIIKSFPKTTSWVHIDDTICKSTLLPLGDPLYIAFQQGASSGTTYYYTGLDNVQLSFLDGCLPPGGLTTTTIDGNTVSLAWLDNNSGSKPYHILVNGDEWLTTAAGATSCTLTDLPRGSYITIGAYADCGDSHSDIVEISVFIACDGQVDFPYLETFDRYNENVYNTNDVISVSTSTTYTTPSAYPLSHTRPDCWRFMGLSATTSTYPQIFIAKNPNYNRDGDTIGHRALMFKTQMTCKQQCYAVLPLANAGNLTRAKLSFDYKQSTATADEGVLSYGVMTNPNDSTTYVNIATLAKVTAWTHIDANIGQAVGIPLDRPLWVAFRFGSVNANTGTDARYTGLDNVQLTLDDDACQAPGLGVSDNTTGTAVTLSWYDNNLGSCTYSVFKDGVSVATGITDTFYTLSGLTAYTDYTFKVQASCGTNPYSELTVRTTCAAGINLPYTENFEGYTNGIVGVDITNVGAGQPIISTYPVHLLPNCWTFTNTSTALPEASSGKLLTTAGAFPNAYITTNSDYRQGSYGLLFRTAYTGKSVYAALPLVNGGSLTPVILNFKYKNNTTTANQGVLSYGVMTNPTDTSTFTPIATMTKTTAWTTITDTLSMHALPSGTLYVAFKYSNIYSSTSYYMGLDDISLTRAEGCIRPSVLTAAEVAGSTARLTWHDNCLGSATYHVTVDGTEWLTTAAGATGCTLTGLPRGSDLTVGVYADCGGGSQSPTTYITVYTPCGEGVDAPYTENFNRYRGTDIDNSNTTTPSPTISMGYPSSHKLPNCWTFLHLSSGTATYPQAFISTTSYYNNDGDTIGHRALVLKTTTTIKRKLYAALPLANRGDLRRLKLSFDYKQSTTTRHSGVLSYGVMTDPEDSTTYVNIATLPKANTWTTINSNLYEVSNLPIGVPLYVAFRYGSDSTHTSNTAEITGIDNVRLTLVEGCLPPSVSVTDNSTGSSITLKWRDNNLGSCTYSVFKNSTSVESGLTDTFYTFSNLTPHTSYTLKVQASCNTNPYSELTVRTTCAAGINLPYSENFEGYTGLPTVDFAITANAQPMIASYPTHILPSCWTFANMSQVKPNASYKLQTGSSSYYPNAYITQNATYAKDTKSLMFRQAYTGASIFASMPLINGGSLTRTLLSFKYYQNYAYTNKGVLSYGVMTDPSDTATYVNIKTLNLVQTTWTSVTDTLCMYTLPQGPLYVTFRFGGNCSTYTFYTTIDDIQLQRLEGCLRPGGLTATILDASDASNGKILLTWNDHNNDSPSPTYSVKQNGDLLHSTTSTLSSDTITGLSTGTTYTFTVHPSCDPTKYSSVTVQFPCTGGTLPYTEDFDSYNTSQGISTGTNCPTTTNYTYTSGNNVMPTCWQFPNINRTTYPQAFLTSSEANSGRTLIMKTGNTTPIVAVIAKDFGVPANQLGISFKYKISNTTYPRLEWGITTNPADAASFIPLGAHPRTIYTSYLDVTANLGDYPNVTNLGTVYFAFRLTSPNTNNYYGRIDNVTVCNVTTTPTVAVLSGDSYTWSSGNGNTYTEPGEYYYRHVVSNCPLVDTLRLLPQYHLHLHLMPNSDYGNISLHNNTTGDDYPTATAINATKFSAGDTLTLTAAPAARRTFLKWEEAPTAPAQLTIVMPAADTVLRARFAASRRWADSIYDATTAGLYYVPGDPYTTRPSGKDYVITHDGDVHIYSERGLAWLISDVNGLNG